MALGRLHSRIELDHPGMIHCGSRSTVSGNIVLRYAPSSTTQSELFGPLRITVNFHGRAKSKIWKNNGQTTSIYRGRAPLFSHATLVHEGPFKAAAQVDQRFPFVVQFPNEVQALPGQGEWSNDPRFITGPGTPLPPSMDLQYRGFAHRFECFTEYRLGTTVSMPRIDIDASQVQADAELHIPYEQANVPMEIADNVQRRRAGQTIRLRNEYLMPEHERPAGFRQKTKALFNSDTYPTYEFEVLWDVPASVFLGSSLDFDVSIKPIASRCTASLVPDVMLQDFTGTIEAHTEVRSEKGILSFQHESDGNEPVLGFVGMLTDKGPFSKANDHTKVVRSKVVSGIPTSFSTFNIVRRYSLEIKFYILAAGKSTSIKRTFPIAVLPPVDAPSGTQSAPPPTAGPSDEAQHALPEYELPPSYDFSDKGKKTVGQAGAQ